MCRGTRVHPGTVAVREGRNRGAWRQHLDGGPCGSPSGQVVASGGPAQKPRSHDQPGPIVNAHERAVGKHAELGAVGDLNAAPSCPFAMKVPIQQGSSRLRSGNRQPFGPCLQERSEVGAPAIGAGPVAGRQGGRLIEKEQLRVMRLAHDRMSMVLVRQNAADPSLMLPTLRKEQSGTWIVNDAAVSHHRSAGRYGNDLSKRRHSVLQGHLDSGSCPGKLSASSATGCMLRAVRANGNPVENTTGRSSSRVENRRPTSPASQGVARTASSGARQQFSTLRARRPPHAVNRMSSPFSPQ